MPKRKENHPGGKGEDWRRAYVGVLEESPKEGRMHQAGAQPKQRSVGGRWEPPVSRRIPREQVLGERSRWEDWIMAKPWGLMGLWPFL